MDTNTITAPKSFIPDEPVTPKSFIPDGEAPAPASPVPFYNRTRPSKDEIRAEIERKSTPQPGLVDSLSGYFAQSDTGEFLSKHVVEPLAQLPTTVANIPSAIINLVNKIPGMGGPTQPAPLLFKSAPTLEHPQAEMSEEYKPYFTLQVPPNANVAPWARPYAEAVAEVGTGMMQDPTVLTTFPLAGVEGAGHALGRTFVGTMVAGLPGEYEHMQEVLQDPNASEDEKTKAKARLGISVGMTGLGAYATTRPGKPTGMEPREAAKVAKDMNQFQAERDIRDTMLEQTGDTELYNKDVEPTIKDGTIITPQDAAQAKTTDKFGGVPVQEVSGETPQQKQIREYRENRQRETSGEAGSVRSDYDLYNSLVTKLRALPNTMESFAAKSEISKQIEDLKSRYGGMPPPATPPLQTFGRTLEDELRDKDKPLNMTPANDNTIPVAGFVQRAKAQIGQGEWSMLEEAGINEFLAGKQRVNVGELTKWVEENGPKAEVRKFGEGAQTPEEREYHKMSHEWYDNLSPTVKNDVLLILAGREAPGISAKQKANALRYKELRAMYEGGDMAQANAERAHWSSIAPKPESEMLGYTEISVVRPTKRLMSREEANKKSEELRNRTDLSFEGDNLIEGNKFPSTHSFPPNTLGWVRGFMETDPKTGKKTFRIIEVQSDWARRVKEEGDEMSQNQYRQRGGFTEKDPRLEHYESLALKAAIDHAVKEGADAISVDDAQTAMLTEGHDRAAAHEMAPRFNPGDRFATEKEAQEFANKMSKQSTNVKWIVEKESEGTSRPYRVLSQTIKPEISQEKGMVAAYDNRLPNILKKLTGEEGKVQEFGEHKMAFEKQPWQTRHYPELKGQEFTIPVFNKEMDLTLNGDVTHTGMEIRLDTKQGIPVPLDVLKDTGFYEKIKSEVQAPRNVSRQDLIFRNPDGSPKTTSTGKVYSLDKFKSEVEGKQFSQFGRKFTTEEAKPKGEMRALKPGEKGEPRSPEAMGITPQPPQWAQDAAVAVGRAIGDAVKGTEEVAKKIGNHLKTGDLRAGIAASRDTADSQANLWGRRSAKSVENILSGEFTDKQMTLAKRALTFVRESAVMSLQDMRDLLTRSTQADPRDKQAALNAIDFAEQNREKFRRADEVYRQLTDTQVDRENQAGYETPHRQGYVMHSQDVTDMPDFFEGGGGDLTSFKSQRKHATFAESIAAGVRPDDLDSINLLESRLARGQKLVNLSTWTDSLKQTVDPVTGKPLVTKTKVIRRPDGSQYTTAPSGYVTEHIGNQLVAVHKGYEGLISALTDPSWYDKSVAGRNIQKANALSKSVSLAIDTFHLGRVAIWESLIKGMGVTTAKLPLPSYKKGITLLDMNEGDIRTMVNRGRMGRGILQELIQNKRDLNGLVEAGMNVGRITDSLHQEWVQKIPWVGTFNKWLFDQFQRGAMTEIGLLELKRQRGMYPELTDREVMRKVAQEINTRFGNFGRQGWFKSRTMQDHMRLLMLAEQWNEGLVKSEVGALTDVGKTAYDLVTKRRLRMGLLGRSVIGMVAMQFVANQLINFYTRGQPTWKNKEEGLGAKLSAWIPDWGGKGPGFFLNPLGLGAEITHLLMGKLEKTSNTADALRDIARSRSSQAMKPVLDFVTGEDFLGRKIKEGDMLSTMMKDTIPAPIGSRAIGMGVRQLATGKSLQEYPGQVQKQVMASFGLKTDVAPSDETRMYNLAHEYRKKLGVADEQGQYESDYKGLVTALRLGNEEEAKKQVETLLQNKDLKTLIEHFKTIYPRQEFTGAKRTEAGFIQSLNPEQRAVYDKMRKDRFALSVKAIQLIARTYREQMSTSEGASALRQQQQRRLGLRLDQ